jgi:hypothetical protein
MKPLAFVLLAVLLCLVPGLMAAQDAGLKSSPAVRVGLDPNGRWVLPNHDRVNEGTVTILSAPVGGVTALLTADLARVLDNDELRVLQVTWSSPSHRANLLGAFERFGVGVARDEHGDAWVTEELVR